MSWWDDIQGFFSPEAGQQRRQWLNRQEDTVGDVMRGYLGPAAQPIGNMAQIAGMLSPGADMMEAADASRGMWNADNPLDAAVAGATMLGATGMMFLPGNFNALQEGVVSVADDLVRAYDPSRVNAITAYHGSPHTFDRFDISKIGTGEGAQAYGHGLYFAENEGVARAYRDTLAGNNIPARNYFSGNEMADPGEAFQRALEAAQSAGLRGDAARAVARDVVNSLEDMGGAPARDFLSIYDVDQRFRPAYEAAAAAAGDIRYQLNPGSLYQVQINADPSQLLDWDAPLSAQPLTARQGLTNYLDQGYGQGFFDDYVRQNPDAGLRDIRDNFDDLSPADMSRELLSRGIPGIRYLDAGSRTAGDGSRNFVIFDDSIVDILKRYGIGAAAVGGGWALAPEEAQAAQSAGLFDPAANDRQILMDWLDSQGL
jgi:hypothetical protein